eukprot:TRINITY_DN34387_c0_g1_i1.p1 TRINITY_DN34387_c0_g1~~TRINITY_DN34387_c0_g1_i1.p1  ORF type:complete len:261 (+),score=50.48 TRINITY_DN34387_c0_g1_i1:81-863(+)
MDKLMAVPELSRATRVVLLRHGESEDNVVMERVRERVKHGATVPSAIKEYMRERVEDPELSAKGKQQAELAGEHWGRTWDTNTVELWCGPMVRNLQTMREMKKRMKRCVKVICRRDLYELQGVVSKKGLKIPTGLSLDEISSKYPEIDVFEGFDNSSPRAPWNQKGYEPRPAQLSRIDSLASSIRSMATRTHTTIVVISHGDLQSHLVANLLRLPNAASNHHRTFYFKNTSVTSLRVYPKGDVSVEEYDNTLHLSGASKM